MHPLYFANRSPKSVETFFTLIISKFWSYSLQWPIYVINSVDNTKLPCYTLPSTQHHSFFRNLTPSLKLIWPGSSRLKCQVACIIYWPTFSHAATWTRASKPPSGLSTFPEAISFSIASCKYVHVYCSLYLINNCFISMHNDFAR